MALKLQAHQAPLAYWTTALPADQWRDFSPTQLAKSWLKQNGNDFYFTPWREQVLAAAFLASGDQAYLIQALRNSLEKMQASEQYLATEAIGSPQYMAPLIGSDLLGQLFCGGMIPNRKNIALGTVAATWKNIGTEVVCRVNRAEEMSLHITAYNFKKQPAVVQLQVWQLNAGDYQLMVGPDENGDDMLDRIATFKTIKKLGRGTWITLELLPGQNVIQLVGQQVTGNQARVLADVAILPQGLRYEKQTDQLVVWFANIGAANAQGVWVKLLADGVVIRQQFFETIAWPSDYQLRPMRLVYPHASSLGYCNVSAQISCSNDELTKQNNMQILSNN